MTTPALADHRMRANLTLALAAAIWGFAFVAQRLGSQHLSTFAFNGVRFGIGALSLLPVAIWFGRRAGRVTSIRIAIRDVLGPGVACGAVLFLGATFQQAGIAGTTAGKAGFITGLYIVLVPLLGIVVRHRTTAQVWAGAALARVGLYLLTVTEALTLGAGDLLVLVGSLFWALHILVIDHFVARHDPLFLSTMQFAACSALSLVLALTTTSTPFDGAGAALLPILYAGVVSVGIAYTLQVVGQQGAKPSTAALILSLEAVFGALGGALMLGESMGLREYAGAALMLAGIIVSQLPERAR